MSKFQPKITRHAKKLVININWLWVGSDGKLRKDFKMAIINMLEVLKDNICKELNVKYSLTEWTDRESQHLNRN